MPLDLLTSDKELIEPTDTTELGDFIPVAIDFLTALEEVSFPI